MLEECIFVWRNSFTRQGEFSYIDQQHKIVRSTFPGSVPTESLLTSVQSALPQPALDDAPDKGTQWHWLELNLDGTTIGYVGIDDAIRVEVPASWLSISAKLLATALTWEWNLREQKLTALGEYAAGAGHEINNPLAAIQGRTAQLLQNETDPHRQQLLQTIGSQTYRIRDMIGDSMLFAHPPALKLAELDLTQLIETVVHQFLDEFHRREISLWGNRDKNTKVTGDETQLSVVIAELIRNSLNAVDDGGRIEIDCYRENGSGPLSSDPVSDNDSAGSSNILLRIADNGCGFTPEQKQHCFDPFYSGREAGRGLGFGLSKCWRIVTQHHGTIAFSETASGLTEFHVCLPEKFHEK
ncbi:Sensor protein ZraS [Thalassoglobus polymorphus]|uniref:histidine kinase n=2 Tax=Thalassoglobus polymorphus TaxID=2527994 RepID=A0A517QIG4_9PLAN|nr:Sensor protein ZraS [Thalassoglobus polymorphus]